MNYIAFDQEQDYQNLLPFTFVRPVSHIRVGILSIAEKWEYYTQQTLSYQSQSYLSQKYCIKTNKENTFINGSVCPSATLWKAVVALLPEESLYDATHTTELAHRRSGELPIRVHTYAGHFCKISTLPDIFSYNGQQIQEDFKLITRNRKSQAITDPHTVVYAPENVFIEEGVKLRACVLNAENGVIYIGKNAQIQEMSVVHGNFALGQGSVMQIGSKMRGDTSIGKFCKVGGEISNSVIFGYSNKGHEGFLGNSVIGEWCNLGADTNTSNLKNNYSKVKLWNYFQKDFVETDKQFCGLMMGDFSKAGINTMFNTATVTGISANIFGAGFPPKFIPSFSWGGGDSDFVDYEYHKALEAIEKMMQRRNISLHKEDIDILAYLYQTGK